MTFAFVVFSVKKGVTDEAAESTLKRTLSKYAKYFDADDEPLLFESTVWLCLEGNRFEWMVQQLAKAMHPSFQYVAFLPLEEGATLSRMERACYRIRCGGFGEQLVSCFSKFLSSLREASKWVPRFSNA